MMSTLRAVEPDWSFARRPFWVFSHLFALTVVSVFIFLGFWQLNRHNQRADQNAIVEARSQTAGRPVEELVAGSAGVVVADNPADSEKLGDGSIDSQGTLNIDNSRFDGTPLDYTAATATGRFVDDDFVRVANRSSNGVAGEHIIGVFQIEEGPLLLVNRGFAPVNIIRELAPAPTGRVTIEGWVRANQQKGWIGATDTGTSDLVPRLDIAAISGRIGPSELPSLEGVSVIPVWLQLDGPDDATVPDPIPLPGLDRGPHLSYMAQWFIFATLGVIVYVALLRRTARADPDDEIPDFYDSL